MSTAKTNQIAARNANFHDLPARNDYTSRFRAIGIPAVAASNAARRGKPVAMPAYRDLPAVLKNGFDD